MAERRNIARVIEEKLLQMECSSEKGNKTLIKIIDKEQEHYKAVLLTGQTCMLVTSFNVVHYMKKMRT